MLATVLTFTILIPLILTGAYFEPANILIGTDLNTNAESDSENETQKQEIPSIDENAVIQLPGRDDASIFDIEEDDGFALSPLFQGIMTGSGPSLKGEQGSTSTDTPKEDDAVTEDTEEKEEESTVPETETKKEEETTSKPQKPETTKKEENNAPVEDEERIKVYMHKTGTYKYMSLTEYLYGVVVAEMPAYFEIEALKAQAIACRSISLYKMSNGNFNADRHGKGGAHICTFSGHCQAYISYEEAVTKWGKAYADSIFEKVRPAVDATKNMVMLYDGAPIDAAYHSMSYKYTDDVKNVWPTCTHPYLKSVSSPENDDFNGVFVNETITASVFKQKITAANKKASFSSDASKWIGKITRNESGRIDTIVIGGVEFTGRNIQSVFGLRAANYKIEYNANEQSFKFTTYGRGHGVGMSQYGANLFAKQGYDCIEILTHYYTGVKIENYSPLNVIGQ